VASLLDDREVTPDERAAIADEPRCGVWVQSVPNTSHCAGDGRALDQAQTDVLIVNELHRCPEAYADQSALVAAVGWPQKTMFSIGGFEKLAYSQRGGIHSDPLVRLLAFRAWGDRDRTWFVELTARDFMRVVDYVQPGDKITLRGHFGLDHRVRTKWISSGAEGMTMRLECACGDTVWLRPSGRLDAVETEVCRINARL
jgi:hypothetical protein